MEANINTIDGIEKVEVLKTFTYREVDVFIHAEKFDGGVAYKASEWKTGRAIIDIYAGDKEENPIEAIEAEAKCIIDRRITMGYPSINSLIDKNLKGHKGPINRGAMPIFSAKEAQNDRRHKQKGPKGTGRQDETEKS